MPKIAAIILAAGQSTRFKDREKKPFATLDGRAVWLRSAELFVTRADVVQTLVVIAREDEENFRRRFGANLAFMNVRIVFGGAARHDSVANALAELSEEADLVAIHDAARPCVTMEQVEAVCQAAAKHGAAIVACPIHDTIKKVAGGKRIEATLPREGLWMAQTPQVFRKDWIKAAYEQRNPQKANITDDAQLVEALGHPVHVVEGHASNIKITVPSDLYLAEAILKSRPKPKTTSYHPFADEAKW